MTKKDNNPNISPLKYKYTVLRNGDLHQIPESYKLISIDYKLDEINDFEPLFYHRLFINNFGKPSIVEYRPENITTLDDGRKVTSAPPNEWKYVIRTERWVFIQIGTEDERNKVVIYIVAYNDDVTNESLYIKEAKSFIDSLLRESNRYRNKLVNPKEEIESNKNVFGYLIDNIYLFNYKSAEMMLTYAETLEHKLSDELLKYHHDEWLIDQEKKDHVHHYMSVKGMFYASSIIYFYVAFEGFVNILYEGLLIDELRKIDNLEKRLDIELKLLLMPTLCDGFIVKNIDRQNSLYKEFIKLRNYRNDIIHSKITDSIKMVNIYESGFLYNCKLNKSNISIIPHRKQFLTKDDVIKVKNIVDNLIINLLSLMEDWAKQFTNEEVINSSSIIFRKGTNGIFNFKNCK